MRQAGIKHDKKTRGQHHARVRAKEVAVEDSKPLTQDELLKWWPFTRLDPKLFPRRRDPIEDVEDALL